MKALVEQYKSKSSPIIKQLDLSFIQHSLERLDDHERRELLPIALPGLSADAESARAGPFLLIVLRLLLDVRIPPRGSKDDEAFRDNIGLSNAEDRQYLAEMISLFFRLKAPSPNQTWAGVNPTFTERELNLFSVENSGSQKIFQRMSELKTKLVAVLASGAFTDEEKFLPALYATSSFDNRIASSAEEIVKRSSVSLEDETLVRKLFEAHSSLPAPYRTRILGILSKSSASTGMDQNVINVVALDFGSEDTLSESAKALAPKSNLERTKLHNALFHYLAWVSRIGPSQGDFVAAPKLIGNMRSYIEEQGWPRPDSTSSDNLELRSKAYETIGMLSRSAKMTVEEIIELSTWLFRSLNEDPTEEAVINIDGALSSLCANFPPGAGEDHPGLLKILLNYMTQKEEAPVVRPIRHAVVKWANQAFPLSNPFARWIDILAIAGTPNERSDVVEQGHKGLDPWTYFAHSEKSPKLPDWEEMTRIFFTQNIADNPAATGQIFPNISRSQMATVPICLTYIKSMMFLSALDDFKIETDWMPRLDALVKNDLPANNKIRLYFRNHQGWQSYLEACTNATLDPELPIVEESLRCFVEVASLCPSVGLGSVADKRHKFNDYLRSNSKEIRSLTARIFGILGANPRNSPDHVHETRTDLRSRLVGAEKAYGPQLSAAEGSLLALAHLDSRSVLYDHARPLSNDFPFHYLVAEGIPSHLQETALDSFAQLWSVGLAIPSAEGAYSLDSIVEKLTGQAKKGNERAIFALGQLATGISTEPGAESSGAELLSEGIIGSILKSLFALHELKRAEVHFTVGDAITATVARYDSDAVKLAMDVEPQKPDSLPRARKSLIAAVLDKLFTDCKGTKPSLLKASGIWLFCVVRYCAHLAEVQSRLREAQAAFMRLLSARDELVQETASRGLSLVYERGDADLKSTLVKDLVSAFTGSGTQLKVEEDTELFEPGALPTGENSSVTSYKDIVNLANEVGDQRLVYKFMSLAANAATWSTRSAFGRFGLSNILGEGEVDPKLYPKLFRYRFDPNSNVQRSMDDIWKALVKDPTKVIDEHFDDILDDLLQSILGREWRMREASCAAISDLLQGRPFKQYESRYQDVWAKALKVLDDVKGSVREAASKLCMVLSNSLVRQLEENNDSSAANAMMKEALPFLMSEKGIESSVKEVQAFATVTVMKICKQGGSALKPFIPDMVPQLLGLLGTIEPEQINYYYQRAGEDTRDQLDKARSQMVNRSPISEAIENCLRFIDEDVMTKLAPRLESTVKGAIALPTKIGCSRVLTTLFTRHASDVKPFSTRLLKLMEKQAMDKNDEVSQAYARSAAYIMRVVSDADKARFCERLVEMYLQSEDETRRQKISDVVVALAKVSSDHFTANETELLPFAYLGAHDTDEYTSKVFKEVWDQHAGSNRTVVRYVPEIVKLVEKCLDTQQWALRHTGAFTVGAMVSDTAAASDATGEISESNLRQLWPIFDKTLALKTFEGKERLLESFPKFVEKGATLWKTDDKVAAQMKKIAFREAKRNNDEYRVHAFAYLWKFAKVRDDLDLLQEIADVVTPHLDALTDEDKMDVDGKEDLIMKTARNGFEAVARGYNRPKLQSEPVTVLSTVMKTLSPYLSHQAFGVIKREVWYDAVYEMMKGLEQAAGVGSKDDELSLHYLKSLDVDMAEAGTEPQRIRRAEAVNAVLIASKMGAFGTPAANLGDFSSQLSQAIANERGRKPKQKLQEAMQTLEGMMK